LNIHKHKTDLIDHRERERGRERENILEDVEKPKP
jgi:hypothetical protein